MKKVELKCNNCDLYLGSFDVDNLAGDVSCSSCNHSYKYIDGKLIISLEILDSKNSTWESVNKSFNPFKYSRNEKFNHPNIINGPKLSDLRSNYSVNSQQAVCVNLGSGQDNIDGFINIDYGQYKNVNLVADITKLPFQSESVDLVISNSVLEHIEDPVLVVQEMYRILRPGGKAYISVPQVSVRHHEIDYFRWTLPGLKRLFRDFKILDADYVRSPAYSVLSILNLIESNNSFTIIERFRLGLAQKCLDFLWKFKFDQNEYNIAASNTIYVSLEK